MAPPRVGVERARQGPLPNFFPFLTGNAGERELGEARIVVCDTVGAWRIHVQLAEGEAAVRIRQARPECGR